ncbi:MAG: hypothetical protein BAJATHORv1_20137 [Candidatus Thorarchaeota archaeon]|nr:MAG: hypothetical protein BAJATHORv1_20137 [Candidatus Thorarchaeota archaeon]
MVNKEVRYVATHPGPSVELEVVDDKSHSFLISTPVISRELLLDAYEMIHINLEPLRKCARLTTIDLSKNCLKSIDLSPLSSCKNLELLNLGINQFSQIDLSPLSDCTQLHFLSLSENQFSQIDLSPLASCRKLKYLFLGYNRYTQIDLSPLASCSGLEILELTKNQFSQIDLSPLSDCTQLHILSLSENQFSQIDLSPLKSCRELQNLDLEYNKLTQIDLKALSSCSELKILELTGNHLNDFVLALLTRNKNLQEIYIGDNNLSQIDISLIFCFSSLNRFWISNEDGEAPEVFYLFKPSWIPDIEEKWFQRLEWESIPSIIKNNGWKELSKQLVTKMRSLGHLNKLFLQGELLTQLELGQFRILDADISEVIQTLPATSDIHIIKRELRRMIIPLLQTQIEQRGPTHLIDVDDITKDEGARLLAPILKSRKREYEQTYILKQNITVDNQVEIIYDFTPLYFTAHGYGIILKLAETDLLLKRQGLQATEDQFEKIQEILIQHNIEVSVSDTYLPFVTSFSEAMSYYLLDLNWELTLNDRFVNVFFETYIKQ